MSLRALMKTPAEVYKVIPPSGDFGDNGSTELVAKVKCLLEPSSGQKVHRKGKDERVTTHTMFSWPVELGKGEYFVLIDGKRYDILYAPNFGTHMEVDVEGPI